MNKRDKKYFLSKVGDYAIMLENLINDVDKSYKELNSRLVKQSHMDQLSKFGDELEAAYYTLLKLEDSLAK